MTDSHTVVVRRRAAGAGAVTVVLHVRGTLEHECYHSDPIVGCVHYFSHYPVDVSSSPFDVTIAAAPMPTSTPTPTPLETARRPGGDGCQLGAHHSCSGTASAPAALRLYERAGFKIWGTEPEALSYDGLKVAEHHMALHLR